MIAHLCGTLLELNAATGHAIVVCGGVGYGVELSQRAQVAAVAPGEQMACFVYTHVAEDQLRLFGFADGGERQAFVALLAASGVGPRLALAILAELTPPELASAVATKDKRALTRVAGVGSKKAERLLLELEGKLKTPVLPMGHKTASAPHTRQNDVQSALVHLGFAPADAEAAAERVTSGPNEGLQTAELVRLALRDLTPGGASLADAARR